MNLLKSASIVSLLTLASRVTGLVREQMVAAAFGASAATDAFNVAFRLPNLFRRLFAEGAFSQAFVPVLAATRAQRGRRGHPQPDRRRGHRAGLGAAAGLRGRCHRRAGAGVVDRLPGWSVSTPRCC